MKEVGIMTFWYDQENYGQILQAYALTTVIRSMGYHAFDIKYDNRIESQETNVAFQSDSLIKKILRIIMSPQVYYKYYRNKMLKAYYGDLGQKKDRSFDVFRATKMFFSENSYNNIKELQNLPPDCFAYVTGSDIVWSEKVNNMAYFLNFGSSGVKRIAYAASFGGSEVSNEYINQIREYLAKFDFIGVRESSGREICALAGRNDAVWVPDPTLLLSQEHYSTILKEPDTHEKYLFLYLLGYKLTINFTAIDQFAKKRGLKIIYVANEGVYDKRERTYPTIEEWIGYIANAEYVITNSFHCCVFCSM